MSEPRSAGNEAQHQSAEASGAVDLRAAGSMRVQVQQQVGGKTVHHASRVVSADGGVTTAQLQEALIHLRWSAAIPKREAARADAALARALQWTDARPPSGVAGRFSKSFYFDPQRPRESWRFDIEGMTGQNLLT